MPPAHCTNELVRTLSHSGAKSVAAESDEALMGERREHREESSGERRGGRQKGTRNKRESLRQQAIEQAGVTPLEFMLNIMGNASNPTLMRLDAAKSAAPYVHARLQSVTLAGDRENPLVHSMDFSSLSDVELDLLIGSPEKFQGN